VLTLPKMLRVYFRYDRRLLGKLCRVAARVITKSFRALADRSDLTPGMVVCVHTYGNFVNFHPHLHVLTTDGGFTANGVFHVLPKVSLSGMEQLFRHRVLKMLLAEGLIRPERVKMLMGWKHSGFNVDGSVRIGAGDTRGRENISRYLIRAPFSVEKIQYSAREGSVIYRTKMVKGPNRNFQIYDPLTFLAAATSHIPDRGEHLVRYYSWYSSVQRGKRRKLGLEEPAEVTPIEEDGPSGKAARRSWARLIRKIYEIDPLECPKCGSRMRLVAFIEDELIVRKILKHLKLWEKPIPRAPPEPEQLPDIEYVPFLD
jgi:hypothetical protein